MTKLLYYENQWLSEFEAKVVRLADYKGKPAIVLDQTAFYPEGGGQPPDFGKLEGVAVIDCQKDNGEVFHVLEMPLTLAEGASVTGQVDFRRRSHNMQKHTGQHLLSAVFLQHGLSTVSVHFGEEESTLDLSGGDLPSDLLKRVEEGTNELIFKNIPVKTFWAEPEELPALGLRKMPEVRGKYRIVEIEGIDRSACGGTHLASTGQIGLLKILALEKVREISRIYFACGWGAYHLFAKSYEDLAGLAMKMTRGLSEVAPAVLSVIEEHQKLRRENSLLKEQLLPQMVAELEKEFVPASGFSFLGKTYDGETEEMRKLAQILTQKSGRAVFLANSAGSWILTASPEVSLDLSSVVKEVLFPLGAKGGGSGSFRQGGGLKVFGTARQKILEFLKNKAGV